MLATTTQASSQFVPAARRIATVDQHGTLWVDHPMHAEAMFVLDPVPAVVKASIVTGGGQGFVRAFAQATYDVPPEQVIGSAGIAGYSYAKDGKPFLTKQPKMLLNNNAAGRILGRHQHEG